MNRGYREQGKSKKPKAKPGFAINQEQMEYERRKLLEEMSTKVTKKTLNNMAAVAATKSRSILTKKEKQKNPQCGSYHSGQGFSLPVSHSWRKKD